jgi:hypothetical protein
MRFAPLMLVLAAVAGGCKIDRDKVVDRSRFTFKTSDKAKLFFRNVRQIYYHRAPSPDGLRTVFRHRQFDTLSPRPQLIAAIVLNDDLNTAYLLLETNTLLADERPLRLVLSDTNSLSDTLVLAQTNSETMLELASQLYEGIAANKNIAVATGNKMQTLFTDEERESFRVTLADYYRLTGVF